MKRTSINRHERNAFANAVLAMIETGIQVHDAISYREDGVSTVYVIVYKGLAKHAERIFARHGISARTVPLDGDPLEARVYGEFN